MDGYSRLVAWLKILLPLAALALLSTLFLLSRNVDPIASLPFADAEIQRRLSEEQVTGPFFSGTTERGDRMVFSAEKLVSAGVGSGDNLAEDLKAQIDLATGSRIVVVARTGTFDLRGGQSTLQGDVVMTTSDGMRILSDRLEADTNAATLKSPGAVTATGPFGTLDAGEMFLHMPESDEASQLIFTNGVKLVYEPKSNEE